ncbi:24820_t:CDS:2 [Dentiscutata erythropus]|uniref:24820_t:CDS:1 n=1 Tax=Dentiscutata erythropus TaxID=1348616 RepID=A0A9N9CVE3_9GLOM|nr:24820_t:CDS:2 [Dentiscutata erythropus]
MSRFFSNVCQTIDNGDDPNAFVFIDDNRKISIHVVGWAVSAIFTIEASLIAFYQMKQQWKYYNNVIIILFSFLKMVTNQHDQNSVTFFGANVYNHDLAFILPLATFYILLDIKDDAKRMTELRNLSNHMSQTHSTNEIKVFGIIKCSYLKQNYLKKLRFGILQYVLVLYITTAIGLVLQFKGKYCEEIFSIHFGQLYLVVIQTISGLVANLCLALFVITYQGHIINILVLFGFITPTKYWQPLNISKGIQAILVSIELFIIALIQIKAFPYRQYRPVNKNRTSIFVQCLIR